MMDAESPLLDGPVFLGRLEVKQSPSEKNSGLEEHFAGEKIWIYLAGFCCVCAVGLTVGALLHRQWTCLPWIIVVWAEYPLISLVYNLKRKRYRPDEHVLAVRDWLRQQTKNGVFGEPPKNDGATVWLTGEGLYSQKHCLPWIAFSDVSRDKRHLARNSEPLHLLTLRLKWSRTIEKWWSVSWMSCSLLSQIIGISVLHVYFGRYGMRDDVLALLFAVIFSLVLLIAFALRFLRERRSSGSCLKVSLSARLVSAEELRNFFRRCLPSGVDLM